MVRICAYIVAAAWPAVGTWTSCCGDGDSEPAEPEVQPHHSTRDTPPAAAAAAGDGDDDDGDAVIVRRAAPDID